MKHTLFILSLFLILFGCTNDDDTTTANPVDQLPPATQNGANTVGCLVNGVALLPAGGGLTPNTICQYPLINGEYFFNVGFFNSNISPSKSVIIFVEKTALQQGETYILNKELDDTPGGGGEFYLSAGNVDSFFTSSENTGELTISYLNPQQSIISGTFWFDAKNEDGEIVEIREGRFDMHYIN